MTIPRVFPMRQEICANVDKRLAEGKTNHYHPASHDPRQFTLLKFYELNKGAIKMLLDSQDDAIDLPFTPGPKEHEIINYQSKESILLMGRSGTGKTTCLVFRMWAQWISSSESCDRPRQVFLTKNNVLCNEVQRSFNNMGLAWRKRTQDNVSSLAGVEPDNAPKFMTSSEWLDLLDEELLGEPFFTHHEREQRQEMRKVKDDTVAFGIEAFLSEQNDEAKTSNITRQEMTFVIFRSLWRKIKSCGSGSKLQFPPVLVWREIQSFIKGSVCSLNIGHPERDLPRNRFLSLEEYLALRKYGYLCVIMCDTYSHLHLFNHSSSQAIKDGRNTETRGILVIPKL